MACLCEKADDLLSFLSVSLTKNMHTDIQEQHFKDYINILKILIGDAQKAELLFPLPFEGKGRGMSLTQQCDKSPHSNW